MKLLMAQLHNTDFLKASSVKVQDIMLTSAHLSLEILKLINIFSAFCAKLCIYVRNIPHIIKQNLNFEIHLLIKTNIGRDLYIKYI